MKHNFTKKQVMSVAQTGLEKAVAEWLCDRADDYDGDPCGPLRDLFQGGCMSGMVSHLVYYCDTVPFYEQHKADIWALGIEQAEDFGNKNVFEFFAGLNVGNLGDLGDYNQVANGLAWYGFEEAARRIENALNSLDEEDEDDED